MVCRAKYPGVTGFVGSAGAGSKPNPLLPDEVRFILKQMGLKENNRYRIRDWRASASNQVRF